MAAIIDIVEPEARAVVESLGYELFDLVFVKEGANWYLRLFIDKEGGVSIDDCERASRAVEKFLDERDPIEQAYILEVSSPGIDRPLKREQDFQKAVGQVVDVKLYKPLAGQKTFRGSLSGLLDGCVAITGDDGGVHRFPLADVASCRLVVFL